MILSKSKWTKGKVEEEVNGRVVRIDDLVLDPVEGMVFDFILYGYEKSTNNHVKVNCELFKPLQEKRIKEEEWTINDMLEQRYTVKHITE